MPVTWPLVGRDEELELIEHALSEPNFAGIVLAGEAGVGKTRLAHEAVDLAAAKGIPTAWAGATEAGRSIPFGSLMHWLPESLPPALSRAEVIRAAASALLDRSKDGRLVVGVDDAHLLDNHSAVLLHDLAQGAQAFVVVTVRTGEPAPDPIIALWKDGLCERFEIQALSEPEVATLLEAAIEGHVEGATGHRLFEHSRGNPLFLRELVLGGLDTGNLAQTEGLWRWSGSMVPSRRVVDLVAARLAGLHAEERDALEIVALGEPLELRILEEQAPGHVLQSLERIGLVVEERSDRRLHVRTSHPLYAEAIRAETAPARAREVAGDLAAALEGAGARRKEDLLRLVIRSLEAGRDVRPDLLLAAAGQALSVLDYGLAERIGRVAFDVLGGGPAAMVLVQALIGQGRFQDADELLVDLVASATWKQGRAQVVMARAHHLMWNMDNAAAALELLGAEADAAPEADLRDELLAGRAHLLFFVGRLNEAIAIGKAVLEGPGAAERTLYNAASAAGQALMWAGRPDESMEIWSRWEEVILRGQQEVMYGPVGRAMYLTVGGWLAGRFKEAAEISEDAYAEVRDLGSDWVRGLMVGLVGFTARLRGRARTATRLLREGAALLRDLNVLHMRSVWLAELGYAHALLGDGEEAREALKEAEQARFASLMFHDCFAGPANVWTAAADGDTSKAISMALDRAEAHVADGVRGAEAILLHDVARLGEPAMVAERLGRLAESCDGRLFPAFASHAAALAARDPTALEQVSVDFEDMGADLLAAEAAAEASRAYRDQGKSGSAMAAASRASALAALCEGARTPALEGIDVQPPLTRREREIATLAAKGLSDKKIAETLVVSVRTVENHLHRIYSKLGLAGRQDLRAILMAK